MPNRLCLLVAIGWLGTGGDVSHLILCDGDVLGDHLGLVVGLVLHSGLGDVLGCVLGLVHGLILHLRLVLGVVHRLGDVRRYIFGRGDVLGLVLGLVPGLKLGHVLNLGLVDRLRDVFGYVCRLVVGVVAGLVVCGVECGRDDLLLINGLVDWNLW